MQMHNHPSHFCIISLYLALRAQSEIANVLPKRCASRKRHHLPDYANIMQNDYAKFMQDDYAKFMQCDYAKFMQHNSANIMQEDYAKSKYPKSEKNEKIQGKDNILHVFLGILKVVVGCRSHCTRGA